MQGRVPWLQDWSVRFHPENFLSSGQTRGCLGQVPSALALTSRKVGEKKPYTHSRAPVGWAVVSPA